MVKPHTETTDLHRNSFSRKEGKGLKAAEGIGGSVGTHGSCVRHPHSKAAHRMHGLTQNLIFSQRRQRIKGRRGYQGFCRDARFVRPHTWWRFWQKYTRTYFYSHTEYSEPTEIYFTQRPQRAQKSLLLWIMPSIPLREIKISVYSVHSVCTNNLCVCPKYVLLFFCQKKKSVHSVCTNNLCILRPLAPLREK